jgi:hypothetical protein
MYCKVEESCLKSLVDEWLASRCALRIEVDAFKLYQMGEEVVGGRH